MKKIVYKFLLFALIFFVLDQLIYKVFVMLHENSPLNPVQNILSDKPEVLFFGSSCTKRGIAPHVLQEAENITSYNLGDIGQGLENAVGVSTVVMSHYQPKMIVLEVMGVVGKERQVSNLARILHYGSIDQVLGHLPLKMRLQYYFIKTIQFNGSVFHTLRGVFTSHDSSKGHVSLKGSPKYFEERKKKRRKSRVAAFQKLSNNSSIRPEEVLLTYHKEGKLLKNFIEYAKRHSIALIFIHPPRISYTGCPIDYIYKKLSEEYQIPFFDFTFGGNKCLDFPDEFFWDDGDHLNENGAKEFTLTLGQAISKHLKVK